MDHSIDIGTKQVFVVLRVPYSIYLNTKGAITLEHCECVGISVHSRITGEVVCKDLENIFSLSGHPIAIVKDNGRILNYGVILYNEKHNTSIKIIDDITHVVANTYKKYYEKTKSYQVYMDMLRAGATKLRQSDLSFLIPPKLRKKGRFQAISKLNNWYDKVMKKGIFSVKTNIKTKTNANNTNTKFKHKSLQQRLQVAFPNFKLLESFIKNFIKTTNTVNKIMKILKTKGLSIYTYNQSIVLLNKLPRNSTIRKKIKVYLDKCLETREGIINEVSKINKTPIEDTTPYPLVITSDIIESLFGKFKYALERNPFSDMNRAVLLIPLLCGNLNDERISFALNNSSYKDLSKWEKDNIPYTVFKKRQEFFKDNDSQKSGIEEVA